MLPSTFREGVDSVGFTSGERYDGGVRPTDPAMDHVLAQLIAASVRPTELGKALGVTTQHASMILKGQRGISRKRLQAVATFLKKNSLGELFSDLPGHSDGVEKVPIIPEAKEGGAAHVPASARVLAEKLESDICIITDIFLAAARKAIYNFMRDVADASTPRKADAPRKRKTGSIRPSGSMG
jgi:transcriptional regulator with XRE-family HTH domain